ncbi:LEA type 2 family protein [Roseateles sp.]|uniref:LEA type 2 family protein n=1 Tax=Roseateles sp. TaxID=1971397 RepID=UPI003BA6E145
MNAAFPRPWSTSTAARGLCWLLAALSLLLLLPGCAGLAHRDALKVQVAGIESLRGEGLELRFLVKLRVQNPNAAAIEYEGVALELDLNGKSFASGVSGHKGLVPRFGESVLEVPLTVSALSAVRQALSLPGAADKGEMPYVLTGKLAGGLFGTVRFNSSGTLKLPN